jgi:hypothetical protein
MDSALYCDRLEPPLVYKGERFSLRMKFLVVRTDGLTVLEVGLVQNGQIRQDDRFDQGSSTVLLQPNISSHIQFRRASFSEVGRYTIGVRFRHWVQRNWFDWEMRDSVITHNITVEEWPESDSDETVKR